MSQFGLFTTRDPLRHRNWHLSPYLYCAANPINYIDPSGCYIRLAPNSTKEFANSYSIAEDYLIKHNSGEFISKIKESSTLYYIEETEQSSWFDHNTNTIFWNPNSALLTNTLYILTPAELLNHEMDHAAEYDRNPKATLKRLSENDNDYGNEEERRVIEGSEYRTARNLGKLTEGQKTRTNHFGNSYKVDSPISDDISILIITFTKDERY